MRSFSKVTRAWADFSSSRSAKLACKLRRRPSKEKGKVAKTTTNAPASRAQRATSGAAPDPVPPPSPTQIKTRRRPRKTPSISSRDPCPASAPNSGSPPQPSPCVKALPNCNFVPAMDPCSPRTSQFMLTNSTPTMPSKAILSITLLPAPPIPNTLTAPPKVWAAASALSRLNLIIENDVRNS